MSTAQILSGNISTQDNISISYELSQNGFDSLVIVCPGFFTSKKNRWIRKTVELFTCDYDTIVFDFRGHGDSSGKFSWSAKESLDLDAVLDFAVKNGYKNIGLLAFSLGAVASINIASKRSDIKSMVLIGCPSSFWKIDYHFWEPEMFSDLKDNFECKWEGKGARVESLFLLKPKPIKNISRINNTSIFFIHGDSDWIIKDYHSKKLFDLANTNKKIEIINKGLHAERLIQQHPDKMKNLILDWFSKTLK
ncbi:MAG: alpha/beta fold hydrolase [Candidatus Omnitrophota bacterium]